MINDQITEINASLTLAKLMCPEYELGFASYNYFNGSIDMQMDTEFPRIMCEAARLILYGASINNTLALMGFILVPLGMLSCILCLAILSSDRCKQPAFIYHRAVNLADLLNFAAILDDAISNYFIAYSSTVYNWKWIQVYVTPQIDRALSTFVESLVAWIAIERALCYFPDLFNVVNKRRFCFVWTAVLFVINNIVVFPALLQLHPSYNAEARQWLTKQTAFSMTPSFQAYQSIFNGFLVFRAVAIALGTFGTLCMLIAVSQKKRRMAKSLGFRSSTGATLLSQAKTNQILCLLQFCEALPLIVRCTLGFIMQTVTIAINFDMFAPLKYDDCWILINKLDRNLKLIFAKKVIDVLAHGMHLFLYLIFLKKFRSIVSNKIRKTLGGMLVRISQSVGPSSS